jgi:gliding motility-associated-like protein/uncharacterized repeat protein (TIGR01451 family)
VVANAGQDRIIGECQTYIELDGTFSKGENLTYRWDPPLYLDNPTSPTPEFRAGETTTYVLTVTDDDDISDSDTMTVTVLPPPLANAGLDKFLMIDGTVALDGRLTTPTSGLDYLWETKDGHIIEGTHIGRIASADSLGTYTLTVTDAAKCISTDTVVVYRFYYLPFAIPDYYSTKINTPLTGENVLANDFDPNNMFTLTVTPDSKTTKNGGKVDIQADGSFVYTPKTGFSGVDDFTYDLCNSAEPPRCSRGYVKITVNNDINIANLNIRKDAINREAKIGEPEGVRFNLTVINRGTVKATNIVLTDTLSRYITEWKYSTNNWLTNSTWTGSISLGSLDPGDSTIVQIRGKLTNDAPDIVYNAAMVSSGIFDNQYDWNDPYNRNVDTARVIVVSDLLAKAELIERWDKNKFDQTIGFCDVGSVLSATKSLSINPIDYYQWVPSAWLKSPNDSITTFTPVKGDTTVTFTLIVTSGERISTASVKVNISPEVIADAGQDKKYNEGKPLVIDATGSSFAPGADFEWFTMDGMPIKEYQNSDMLHPIVNGAGVHMLIITDKHGCSDIDTLTIRENQLYAMNDILVVVINDTVMSNVMTNDYDPDGDSLYFTGVTMMPVHGDLLPAPPGINGPSANNVYISDNGNFIYKPDKDYIGDDQFTYRICDDNNPDLCREAKVFIKVIDVSRVNSQPVANSDYFFINKNDTLVNNLMLNDFDYDGGLITLNTAPMSVPKKGKVTLLADGTMTYIPNTGEEGIDSFMYRICDFGKPSLCDTAFVYINIFKLSQENHKPVAVDDAYYAVEKAIKGNILANDYDADGNPISLDMTGYSLPKNGSLFLSEDGNFEYTPNLGFEGTDYFTYTIYEVGTAEMYSSSATVYITSLSEDRYYTDVEIAKSGPANILSGDTLIYKLDINILGSTLANDIVITDTLYSGLSNPQFSLDDGITWEAWKGSFTIQQMMLYDDIQLLIRGLLPDIYSGRLPNTGWVDHDMHETKPENNDSTFIVDVYQRVIANAGNDTIIGACYKTQEDGFVLDASKSLGMSTLTYKWTPADKAESPDKVKSEINLEADDVQKFTLVVTSSFNGYFDSDTAEVWVEVAEKAVADAGRDIEPTGKDSVWLDGSMSNGAGQLIYTWWYYDINNNVKVIGKEDSVKVGKTGEYYLTVTDIYGCDVTDRVNVIYPIDPFIAVDDETETPQQEQIKIPVLANDIIDPDDEYDFDMFIVIQQPTHGTITEVVQETGDSIYAYILYTPDPYFVGVDTFTYIVSTKYSNPDEAIVIVKVLERSPIVPGGFSPNGDGINDFLIIENIEKYEYNVFTVFNRWGNVVYKKEKYTNDEPWNGVANKGVRIGRGVVPGGAYMFLLDLGDDERIPKEKNPVKGNIYVATE